MNEDGGIGKYWIFVDSNENVYLIFLIRLHSLEFFEKLILVNFNLKRNDDQKVKKDARDYYSGTDFLFDLSEYLPKSKDNNTSMKKICRERWVRKLEKKLFALISEKNTISIWSLVL